MFLVTDPAKWQNTVLRALPRESATALAAELEALTLPARMVLCDFDTTIEHVYFIETGLGSSVIASPDGQVVETLIVGNDGFVGLPVVLGGDRMAMKVFMQAAGTGFRIATHKLRAMMEHDPALRAALFAYVRAALMQISYTALSNASHRIEQRLARWLLMAHDRVAEDTVELTHEFLSIMLNVRRSSVTDTLHILEGEQLIRSLRGRIVIRDRTGLEQLAAAAYGVPEAEARRAFAALESDKALTNA